MRFHTKRIVFVGLLIALEIILSRLLSFTIPPLIKASVAFIPIVIAGYLYGPLWAGAAAAVADFFGTILFPVLGGYQPWFTITAFLVGVTYGLFLYNRRFQWWHAVASAVVVSVLLRIGLNCLWFYILFGWAFVIGFLPGLVITHLTMAVVQTAFILLLNRYGKLFMHSIIEERFSWLRAKARSFFTGRPEVRMAVSAMIAKNCLSLNAYKNAKTVFCFVGTEKEIDTTSILQQAFSDGKTVCVPVCEPDKTMTARLIHTIEDINCVGPYGILEPASDAPIVVPRDIDIAFVPCVAADKRHNRIGKGSAYYDRYLKDTAMEKVGICPAALIVGRLPVREHDVPVNVVVTEKRVF